jgi:hypothetical protein
MEATFTTARREFHNGLFARVLTVDSSGVPSNADKHNVLSVRLAQSIVAQLSSKTSVDVRVAGQTSGSEFEQLCAAFLESTFLKLQHLRPGKWAVEQVKGHNRLKIAEFAQYAHLVDLERASRENPALAAALGSDYTITPDILVLRNGEDDETINTHEYLVDSTVSRLSTLRRAMQPLPILHASISCKWTIRSDRVQNARSEALNLIKNRKGRAPHIAVITAEPLPSRLAAIALGTGEIDCVYHFALHDLEMAISAAGQTEALDTLHMMISGRRLKDIADLPLDLAI